MTKIKSFIKKNDMFLMIATFFGVLFALHPDIASATETSDSMPWSTPLQKVRESIRGPVAYSVSIVGLIASGARLVWGGEISEFTKTMMYLVLVISILALAMQAYTTIWGAGALV